MRIRCAVCIEDYKLAVRIKLARELTDPGNSFGIQDDRGEILADERNHDDLADSVHFSRRKLCEALNHAEQKGRFARDKRRLILSPERLDERWQQG